MTESQWTAKWVKELKDSGLLLTFKHADAYTPGVPDVSCTSSGHTTWIEAKILQHGQLLYSRVHERQWQFTNMLAMERNSYQAFYYVRNIDGKAYRFMPSAFGVQKTNEEYFRIDGVPTTVTQLYELLR
jgi:hypothetical protein